MARVRASRIAKRRATSAAAFQRALTGTVPGAAKVVFHTVRYTARGTKHTVKFSHRHRVRLAPVGLAALLLAAGEACHAGGHGPEAAGLLTVATALCLGFRLVRAQRAGRELSPQRLRNTLIAFSASVVWLFTTAIIGLDRGTLTAGVAGAVLGFGVPWWWHHRAGHDTSPTPEHAAEPEALATWRTLVAANDGALPGAILTNLVVDEQHTAGLVQLVRGKQTATSAITATERIASAFGVSVDSVVLEHDQTRKADLARFAVYHVNPLQTSTLWAGPHLLDMSTGLAPLGVYQDASFANYRFFRPGSGSVHDLISGASDSGKSTLIGLLLSYERHNGFVSIVIDPQRGQSLPDWQDAVPVFARSAEEGLDVLRRVKAGMLRRNELLADLRWVDEQGRQRRGVPDFTHTPQMPLAVVTIDEAHAILRQYPEAVAICEDIAKMGRKCGIKLRLATQVPLLDQLGNSNTMREQVAAGNVIVLRTGGRMSGQVAFQGQLPVDPFLLPREWPDGSSTAGLGYLLSGTSREAPMRTLWVPDMFGYASSGEPGVLEADFAALLATTSAVALPTAGLHAVQATPSATIRQRVVDFLADKGVLATTGTVAQALNIALPTASTTLGRLAEQGLVEKVQTGLWRTQVAASEDERELVNA